jgi:hypothetical protein
VVTTEGSMTFTTQNARDSYHPLANLRATRTFRAA